MFLGDPLEELAEGLLLAAECIDVGLAPEDDNDFGEEDEEADEADEAGKADEADEAIESLVVEFPSELEASDAEAKINKWGS